MELTVDQALQKGIAAHREGKLQDAERLYRAILQTQPNHPDANHNLGVLAVAVGKPLDAIPLFKLAVEANPKVEQFWLSYIDVLIRLERFDEAKRVLAEGERSGVSVDKLDAIKLRVKGDSSDAVPPYSQLNNLQEHYQTGKLEEAEELAKLLTQQFPKHPFGWKVLGAVLQQAERLSESLLPMRESVDLSPQDAEAHSNLGATLKKLGRLEEAEASLRQAIGLKPDYVEAHSNLGITLRELGRLEEAEATLRQAIALKPDYAVAHNNLGNTRRELGRLEEAEASYRKAVALRPNFAEAHRNLGVAHLEIGSLDEAEASFRQAIALKPDDAEAHASLATVKKFSSEDEQFFEMQALYHDATISHKNRGHICFALAKASEDLGDLAAAFRFYAEGNALRKKELGYNAAQDEQLFESLKGNYQQISDAVRPAIIAPEHAPIFIVGMPRSGTTLVEQIISSHPLVTGAGELGFVSQFGRSIAVGQTPVNAEVLTTFREEYLSALKQRSKGNAIVTDKMPQNFCFLGLIATALLEAKIIHVKRDPAAVCWAIVTALMTFCTITSYIKI
jgi:tetratricopeptide (TPR) repeat protein